MAISPAAIEDLTRRGAQHGVDIRPGLALVERRMQSVAASDLPLMEDAGRWLIDAGGKRFRPMLVLLSGMLGGGPLRRR
jgi:heptaprenyl diphosphate synthase